jgi:tetratricopeptide (TPR) repeat protein
MLFLYAKGFRSTPARSCLMVWMTEAQFQDMMQQLIAAGLVTAKSSDEFAFRHAMLQDAVYATLLRRERRDLHRIVAETLERLSADSPDRQLADLAYHYYAAEAWQPAFDYSRRVGERAQALYAPHEAVEHFTHALKAEQYLQHDPSPDLFRARGLAYETLGEFERARADFEDALAAARPRHDPLAEWQSFIDLGELWAGRDYSRTGAYYRQAMELARSFDDPAILAHTLNRLANWHVNVEQPVEARRYHTEALEIFNRLNHTQGIAETLDLLGMTTMLSGDLMAAQHYYEQAVKMFRDANDQTALASSLAALSLQGANYQTNFLLSALNLVDGVRHGEQALQIAREIKWRAGEAFACIMLATAYGSRGEYDRALALFEQGTDIAEAIQHRQWMTSAYCLLGALYLDLLQLPMAQASLERALTLAREIGSRHWLRTAGGLLACTHVQQRDWAQAEIVVDSVTGDDALPQTVGQRQVWCAKIELALARRKPDQALQLIEQYLSSTPQVSLDGAHSILRIAKLQGEALLQLNRLGEAEESLRAAQSIALEQGARPLLWRICAVQARLYHAWERDAEAENKLAEAGAIVDALSLHVPDQALKTHFLSAAKASLTISD